MTVRSQTGGWRVLWKKDEARARKWGEQDEIGAETMRFACKFARHVS